MKYEEILKRMLDSVKSEVDRREGSIIYDALAPAAAELAQMYVVFEHFNKYTFCDEATGDYLTRRCAERGINRKEATPALRKGRFNVEVPIGSLFECEGISYIVKERIENSLEYKLLCQENGNIGNIYEGELIPILEIGGLKEAVLEDILIPGEDREEDESLRYRYFESLESEAFGGNITDYKETTKRINGVGGVKVEPAWNGGGTVKLVIVGSEYNGASEELVYKVQSTIDPEENSGQGVGLAPIGHRVTVESAKEIQMNVSTKVILKENTSWEDVQPHIVKEIEQYLLSLKKAWEKEEKIVVRISQLESAILRVHGLIDIQNTKINNEASNIILEEYEIPVLGGVESA